MPSLIFKINGFAPVNHTNTVTKIIRFNRCEKSGYSENPSKSRESEPKKPDLKFRLPIHGYLFGSFTKLLANPIS